MMKQMLRFVTVLAVLVSKAEGQSIYVSPPSLQFDTLATNQRDSLSFFVVNHGSIPLTVTDINTNKTAFFVPDTAFTVPVNDSVMVRAYFQTTQNVTWADVISVENVGAHGTLSLRVRGTARYPEALYASTQGLWENDLKTALLNLVNNQTVLGYTTARDRMFETIDDPLGNDTLECVYTGRRIHAATRTEGQNQGFNTEHSWPQSTFNSQDPMVSDINHLFPVDEPANSARANYPFGPVVSNIVWQAGGSRLGRNPNGQTVFEPRDSHKGDVARVMFYFLLRYPTNYGTFMDANQELYLRQWYRSDPVSTKELLRTTAIALYQGKRNPLVDHPEFIDRISYFRTTSAPPQNPDIAVSPATINFGQVAVGDSVDWKLLIMNHGGAPLTLTSISLQTASSNFQVVSFVNTVPADSFEQVRIRFRPTVPNQSSANSLVIQSNDPDEGTLNVALSGSSGTTSVEEHNIPNTFELFQNYPNPFNPVTNFQFSIVDRQLTILKVFDVLGREVATVVDGTMNPGIHLVSWNAFGLPSGVYFYRLTTDSFTATRKLILLQ